MEGYKNQHSVEKKLKEAMSSDRARIQIGRISHFGLLELSRQRLRPSVSENYFSSCSHCGGTGVIRSVESSALRVLRKIEETNLKNEIIEVIVPSKIGMYILNQKRKLIQEIENKLNLNILFKFDDQDPDLDCKIEKRGILTEQEEIQTAKENEKQPEGLQTSSKIKKPRRNPWRKIKSDDKVESSKLKVDNKQDLQSSELLKNTDNVDKKSKNINKSNEKNILNKSNDKVDERDQKDKSILKKEKKPRKISNKKNIVSKEKDNNKNSKEEKYSNKIPLEEKVASEKNNDTQKLKEKTRVPKSSQKLDVVNVDNINKEKKGGWWSQSKS